MTECLMLLFLILEGNLHFKDYKFITIIYYNHFIALKKISLLVLAPKRIELNSGTIIDFAAK